MGEVSTTNDDAADNRFLVPKGGFQGSKKTRLLSICYVLNIPRHDGDDKRNSFRITS